MATTTTTTTANTTELSVSVIICAYTLERWELLQRAVDSALDQTLPPAELLVVIDHNEELLRRSRDAFPRATVVPNTSSKGLSGARNTGWERAIGVVVAFLDDDAAANETWLEHLAGPYADETVAGVGGSIIPEWAGTEPDFLPPEFWWTVGCTHAGVATVQADVRNMFGANMSLRRSVLERVGGFDTGLGRIGKRPVGCEETELCIRVRSFEPTARIINAPESVVHHHVPSERSSWKYFRARCYAEGLSKARVTHLQGANAGLEAERDYVLRSLTRGFMSNIATAVTQRRRSAALRSIAIPVGLMVTTAGYVVGTAATLRKTRRDRSRPSTDPIPPTNTI